ncbi:hypothetical protein M2367_000846 [Aeromonas sp. BIGb0445]|nr:hypothetical protein [Aeromonas sp. BIGb0445]
MKNAQSHDWAEHATSMWHILRMHSCSPPEYQLFFIYTNINLTY